jgi:hypothetical protein
MTKVLWRAPSGVADVRALVQSAIDLECATVPPCLYSQFSILPATNRQALSRIGGSTPVPPLKDAGDRSVPAPDCHQPNHAMRGI